LSELRAEIVYHERVIRIPLPNSETLEVHGERSKENLKCLVSMKADEKKLEDILIGRDFPKVFLGDLMRLPPLRQTKFRIHLIPEATPIAKDSYRLAPFEMQELSNQLQELQDKGFIHPKHSPWGEPALFVKKKNGSFRLRYFSKIDLRLGYHQLRSSIKEKLLATQNEETKEENVPEEMLRSLDQQMKKKGDRDLYFMDRIWVHLIGDKTTNKVVLRKERLKAARDCQKSYLDNRRKPLEFKVGDQVLLKVSPWKGVVHFRKKAKLALRYVGPFEILKRIGLVAYRLRLPQEFNSIHDTFHVLNLKACLADANLHVPLKEIKVDKTLCFVEEPVEIIDHEVKKLKPSRILIVKLRWNFKRGPEKVRLPHIGYIVRLEGYAYPILVVFLDHREVRLPHIGYIVGSEGYAYLILVALLDRREYPKEEPIEEEPLEEPKEEGCLE
nr:putative reverse transcriptase domain-containing protein [Tanacetum cinerariifolium]